MGRSHAIATGAEPRHTNEWVMVRQRWTAHPADHQGRLPGDADRAKHRGATVTAGPSGPIVFRAFEEAES